MYMTHYIENVTALSMAEIAVIEWYPWVIYENADRNFEYQTNHERIEITMHGGG